MVLILSFDLVFNTSPTDFKEIFIKNVCSFGVSVMLSEIRDDIVDRQANNIAVKQTSSRTMVRRRKKMLLNTGKLIFISDAGLALPSKIIGKRHKTLIRYTFVA